MSGTIEYILGLVGPLDDLRRDVVLRIASSYLKREHGIAIPRNGLSVIDESNNEYLVSAENIMVKVSSEGVPELVPNPG